MTAHELQKITDAEERISAEQMMVVEELVDCLPWFSCGQLLLLKAMKQRRHPFFDTRLAFASLYAIDRQRLHRYLERVNLEGAAANEQYAVGQPDNDGFELMDSDTSCEKMVEAALPTDEKQLRREQGKPLVVTETLADVYLAQGMVDKAMQIYKQLSLVYPEKRAYFATRLAAAAQSQRMAAQS